MTVNSKKPILFANCIPVKGNQRSIICDLQLGSFELIPNDLYDILVNHRGITFEEILSLYPNDKEVIEEYFTFLTDKGFIFFSAYIESFPKLDLSWDAPVKISNAIIDFNSAFNPIYDNVVSELDLLGCKHLQVRSFLDVNLESLDILLGYFDKKRILSIELFIKNSNLFSEQDVLDFLYRHRRVSNLYLHSSENNRVQFEPQGKWGTIYTIKQEINSSTHCGVISMNYFTINIPAFTESQKHNTCLNRKISIDTEGYIRNCPSMPEHYGNIKDTTLQEAMTHPDFQKYWFINKDQINVCKDCEFRYICTDCRAYIENPEDMYSKPLKCGYNPYTCEWEEWSTNPLKQKAIDHYEMREILTT